MIGLSPSKAAAYLYLNPLYSSLPNPREGKSFVSVQLGTCFISLWGVFKAKIFFFFFLTHLIEAAHWSLILRDRTVTKQTAIGAVTYGSPLKEQQEAADKMQT